MNKLDIKVISYRSDPRFLSRLKKVDASCNGCTPAEKFAARFGKNRISCSRLVGSGAVMFVGHDQPTEDNAEGYSESEICQECSMVVQSD